MVKFADDQNLGKVISSQTLFSEIGNKPITDRRQLIIAGGRHKMSRLCGFLFTSNVNEQFPQFGIVFICKLRSKLNHQQKKYVDLQWTIPSRWFALSRISGNQLSVMNKQTLMNEYQFDIDQFFKSDLFEKEAKNFQKTVKKGIPQARKFAESIKDSAEKTNAIEEVSSIELSIPLIAETRFEDKNYKLVNYEIKEKTMANDKDKDLNEASFDHYDWKNGSVTGKGLIEMIQDSNTKVQNTLNAPIRIYDRHTNAYFNIVDSHLGQNNTGFMIEIDTSKHISVESDEKKIDEADDREPLSHALDAVGVKASTANSIEQNAVEMQLIEKEIDADIEEAMKEIYK